MALGDHLFYYRGGSLYSHHGICCGDGTVIHYESSIWQKLGGVTVSGEPPQIKRVSVKDFSFGNRLSVRPYGTCDPPHVVFERGLSRLGEVGYSLLGNNCEHFAVWCKTGQPHSTQVDAHFEASKAVVQGAPIGVSLIRAARRVPRPYRGWAYALALTTAGAVYSGAYLKRRYRDMKHARS